MKRSLSVVIGLILLAGLVWGVMAGRETAVVAEGQWFTRATGVGGQKISMVSENDGWFVYASDQTAYLARWDGANWSPFGSVAHSQVITGMDIEMVSSTDGWLVLGGWLGGIPAESRVYRWDGSDWNYFTTITDLNGIALMSLDVMAADNVWAMGIGNFWGSLYHWNGTSWNFTAKTPGGVWTGDGLDMLAYYDGWAVGLEGAITRWNGTSWVQVSSPTTEYLTAVGMVNSNGGWAVGDGGTILKWNGTAWSQFASPTTSDLSAIDMVSADEGWIVGSGTILYWNGVAWSQYTPPTSDIFNDIDMLSAESGWILGGNSLLEYEVVKPELLMNYTSGAPGSYLSVGGNNFPANETATITVNGHVMGTTAVGGNGSFLFILTTTNADEGEYYITASVNPSATKKFILNAAAPVRPQEDTGDTFDVPAGIAFDQFIYLPAIVR